MPVSRKIATLSNCSYLKTRPVGLQGLEYRHGHSPLVHLHPQVPVIEAGIISNGFVIFCNGDGIMDTSGIRERKGRPWQQKHRLKTFERLYEGLASKKTSMQQGIEERAWVLESNF